MEGRATGGRPPIFGGTHFTFYAGPMTLVEELAEGYEEEPDLSFVSPKVPGRMKRGATPEDG